MFENGIQKTLETVEENLQLKATADIEKAIAETPGHLTTLLTELLNRIQTSLHEGRFGKGFRDEIKETLAYPVENADNKTLVFIVGVDKQEIYFKTYYQTLMMATGWPVDYVDWNCIESAIENKNAFVNILEDALIKIISNEKIDIKMVWFEDRIIVSLTDVA